MRVFFVLIIAGIISSIIFLIARKKARKIEKIMDANDFVIRQPKVSLILYIVIAILVLIVFIGTFLSLDNKDFIIILIFLPVYFIVFGPFFIIIWFRWKMIIKNKQITFTSYFGKKKSFTFDYITIVKHSIGKGNYKGIEYMTAYHENKKLFSFSSICPGFQVLFQRIKNEGIVIK